MNTGIVTAMELDKRMTFSLSRTYTTMQLIRHRLRPIKEIMSFLKENVQVNIRPVPLGGDPKGFHSGGTKF